MFVLQKIIGLLFSPLSILFLGLVFAASRAKKNSYLIYLFLMFFYLLCIDPTKQAFLYPIESYVYELEKESQAEEEQAKAIVLLGGGVSYHGDWDQPRLSLDALARAYKAKQVYDDLEGEIPIISSAGLPDPDHDIPAEGVVLASVLENMQVYDSLIEKKSRNTFENALLTRKMLEENGQWFDSYPIILVTSALHLPRAIACFEKQGFKVFPKASHYLGAPDFFLTYSSFAPLPANLSQISQAAHEYLGFLYYKVLGRI